MLYRSVDLNSHCQENAKDALFTLGFQSFLQNVNLTIIGCIALREKICNKIQQKATFKHRSCWEGIVKRKGMSGCNVRGRGITPALWCRTNKVLKTDLVYSIM